MRRIININKGWNFVKKDLIVAKVLNEKALDVTERFQSFLSTIIV